MSILKIILAGLLTGIICIGAGAAPAKDRSGESDPGAGISAILTDLQKQIVLLPDKSQTTPGQDSQLEAYQRLARRENLGLLLVEGTLLSARDQLASDLTALLPQLDLSLSFERQEISRQELPDKYDNAYTTGFQVTQTIWDGQLLGTYLKQVAEADYYRFSRDQAEQDLDYQVARAYFNLVNLSQTILEEYDQVKRLETQLYDIRKMFSAGSVTMADVLRAESALISAENILINRILTAREQAAEINQIFHRPPATPVQIHRLGQIYLFSPDEDRCLTLALANRPEIKEKEALLDAAGAVLFMATQNFFPTASVQGTYGTLSDAKFSLTDPDWEVLLTLDFPLFHSGQNWFLRSAAKALEKNAEISLELTRAQVTTEINNTLLGISTSINAIHLLKRNVDLSRQQLQVERSLFRQGEISTLDLYQSLSAFINSRIDLINAVTGYQTMMNQLKKQLGGVPIPRVDGGPPDEILDCRLILKKDTETVTK